MRDPCLDVVRKLFPGINSGHDFDIAFLSIGKHDGPLTNEAMYVHPR